MRVEGDHTPYVDAILCSACEKAVGDAPMTVATKNAMGDVFRDASIYREAKILDEAWGFWSADKLYCDGVHGMQGLQQRFIARIGTMYQNRLTRKLSKMIPTPPLTHPPAHLMRSVSQHMELTHEPRPETDSELPRSHDDGSALPPWKKQRTA